MEPNKDAPFVPKNLTEWYGYLNTPEGRKRFPRGRFPARPDDSSRLDNYLRDKEPWRYEHE